MCTGLSFKSRDHYFGRNLDLEFSYNETVTVTPRNFPFVFRQEPMMRSHYAMIGMATISEGFPLYYDATNEVGLSMAGLNFPGNAVYHPILAGVQNIGPFEFIPWILGSCSSVEEAQSALSSMQISDIRFSEEFPQSPLHWIISDADRSITVESVHNGLKVYENPYGVLTNNPPFDMQSFALNDYAHLSARQPDNTFSDALQFDHYSRGMGALGLPGDLSSKSRFVRAVFTKMNSICGQSESESLSQFFQILGSVAQQRGCVLVEEDGKYEITIYSSCCNTDAGIYYYRTYENSQICAVDMHREDLDAEELVAYPLEHTQRLHFQN